MTAKPLPSADYLRSIFRYDPNSGRLIWRKRADAPKRWNTRYGGRRAGSIIDRRRRVTLPGQRACAAARIIWKMVHDEEPEIVDHVDGNPRNDRLWNLRAATMAQNARNTRSYNRTGFKGVVFERRRNRWRAGIQVDGRKISLGYFRDPAEAHAAYVEAAKKHFGEFARTK
jgi:hypothetical protein